MNDCQHMTLFAQPWQGGWMVTCEGCGIGGVAKRKLCAQYRMLRNAEERKELPISRRTLLELQHQDIVQLLRSKKLLWIYEKGKKTDVAEVESGLGKRGKFASDLLQLCNWINQALDDPATC